MFRLDPKLDVAALHLPRVVEMMAEAAQRYGIIVRDKTLHAIGFYAEDPSPLGHESLYAHCSAESRLANCSRAFPGPTFR